MKLTGNKLQTFKPMKVYLLMEIAFYSGEIKRQVDLLKWQ